MVKPNEVITWMIKRSGASYNGVSKKLDKHINWCRNIAVNTKDPAVNTIASIADALNMDVSLVDRDTNEIVETIQPYPIEKKNEEDN